MNNDLTKRLIERKYNRDVDMNPEGLSLDQIKELDLTAENWGLLAEIEQDKRKSRADVIAWANEAAGKATKEADLDKKAVKKGEVEEETPLPAETGQLEPGRKNLEVPVDTLRRSTPEEERLMRAEEVRKAEAAKKDKKQ